MTAERLAAAVVALAAQAGEPDVRAQLHALAALLRSPGRDAPVAGDVAQLRTELEHALAAGDEPAVVAAARQLARAERVAVTAVDWSAASHG